MKAPIPYKLALRTSRFFWRENLAPALCIAILTGIFVCSLCISSSLINSMNRQVNDRLGRIASCLSAPIPFRAQLANDIAIGQKRVSEKENSDKAPSIVVAALKFDAAMVSHISDLKTQRIGENNSCILWGVDEKFSHLESNGKPDFKYPQNNNQTDSAEATVSQHVAKLWNLKIGDGLILMVERPQDIPVDSPFAKLSGTMTNLSVTIKNIVPDNTIASLNLKASQYPAVNVFVPLEWLQKKMGLNDRANIILADSEITYNYQPVLDDFGFQFNESNQGFWSVSSNRLSFSEQERIALQNRIDALHPQKHVNIYNIVTALVNKASVVKNGVKIEDRPYISYSFLAGTDDVHVPFINRGQIAVNQWTADELSLEQGDILELEFYSPNPTAGRCDLLKRKFVVSRILEDKNLFSDESDWVPYISGVTDKPSIHQWDISVPINNQIIKPEEEEYWDYHGQTPKFYINFDEAKEFFATSAGIITSVRIWGTPMPNSSDLAPVPQKVGWTFIPLKDKLFLSATGAYDFALFFVCISLTIIFFSLVLTVLFMRLNMNYRCKCIGLLQAVGWNSSPIRQSFIYENLLVSAVGTILGTGVGIVLTLFAIVYLNNFGLDIIGLPFVQVSINVFDFIIGAVVSFLITFIATIVTIRNLDKIHTIQRLHGQFHFTHPYEPDSKKRYAGVTLKAISWIILLAVALTPLTWKPTPDNFNPQDYVDNYKKLISMTWNQESMKWLPRVIFFAAVVSLALEIWSYYYKLKRIPSTAFSNGFCNYVRHPRRSFFIMTTGAAMLFLIPSLSLFMYRTDRTDSITVRDNGGYRLVVKTALPIIGNLNHEDFRETLGFKPKHQEILNNHVDIDQAMLRDGDDASLNNLYYPSVPRIIGVSPHMMNNPLFAWKDALVPLFPWGALWEKDQSFPMIPQEEIKQEQQTDDPEVIEFKPKQTTITRVMPFIIDAQTMKNRYHLKGLNSKLLLDDRPGRATMGRVVAIMDNDMFHGSLITSVENVRRFFPETRGYRMFFVKCLPENTSEVRQALQEGLEAYGPEIESVFECQNRQMSVHNSWIRLSQVWLLVGLGLGCLCYYPILRRNLLYSKPEMASLYSSGFSISQIRRIMILELIHPLSHGINTGTKVALAATIGATLAFKNLSLLSWTGGVWLTAAAGCLILSWIASSLAAKGLTNESMSETLKENS